MELKAIHSEQEMDSLTEEWNILLRKSASDVPFLRHEYLTSWWNTCGGGEWKGGKLAVITGRSEGGELQGIAPFFQVEDRILFLGSIEISDFLDLICPEDLLPKFIRELLKFLSSEYTSWKLLDLYNLPDTTPTIPALQEEVKNTGWNISQGILQPAPFINLPETWDEYLISLDARYKSEIKRKLRKAETYFLPVDWYIADPKNGLDQEMDYFLELMAKNPAKAEFLTDQMVLQMKTIAEEAAQQGWLQLAFLTVGDIRAAGYLNFDYNQKIWVYNSGIDPMFENISPGWVLLGKIIQWAIQSRKTELDFMRGGEPYKYYFGGKDKHVVRIQIQPR
jgi:hypothetical protein